MKSVIERNLGFIGFPNYSVDTEGNVWSLKYHRGCNVKKLKLHFGRGYLQATLSNDKNIKIICVHKLVAQAFPEICGEWFEGCVADHINTIRTDNRAENLRVCTQAENCNNPLTIENIRKSKKGDKNPMYGKTLGQHHNAKPILQYTKDGTFVKEYSCAREAEKLTGVCFQNISHCLRGRIKSAGGYTFKYKVDLEN